MTRNTIMVVVAGLALVVALVLGMRYAGHASEPAAGTLWREPRTGMAFVWIPSGCFRMGFPDINESGSHPDRAYEQPEHRVCVQGFYLAQHEVTQATYLGLMGRNPSRHAASPDAPVERVSWNDAVAMATRLDATGKLRLPTEAEWEYACRAGGEHLDACGAQRIEEHGWTDTFNSHRPQPVGGKRPNAWGLHDMSGNVWEMTQDCWHPNYRDAPGDGSAWLDDGDCGHRVQRGGAFEGFEGHATDRGFIGVDDLRDVTGFRLAYAPSRGDTQ